MKWRDQKFLPIFKIRNKDSGTYYGEYPLSFAASVGNLAICKLLYEYQRMRIYQAKGQDRPAPMAAALPDFLHQSSKSLERYRELNRHVPF